MIYLSLKMAIVIPLRVDSNLVDPWLQMEFSPHFYPAISSYKWSITHISVWSYFGTRNRMATEPSSQNTKQV